MKNPKFKRDIAFRFFYDNQPFMLYNIGTHDIIHKYTANNEKIANTELSEGRPSIITGDGGIIDNARMITERKFYKGQVEEDLGYNDRNQFFLTFYNTKYDSPSIREFMDEYRYNEFLTLGGEYNIMGETNFHNIVLARSDFQHNLFTTSNSALFGIIKYIKDSISKDLDNYILVNIDINTGELDLLSTISIREFFSD